MVVVVVVVVVGVLVVVVVGGDSRNGGCNDFSFCGFDGGGALCRVGSCDYCRCGLLKS